MSAPRVPVTTYRLQLNGQLGFADAAALIPYLHALGIGDVYASPILTTRRGSTHGYDVTDPTSLSPERGGEAGFARLSRALRDHGMGLLLDIVPNHMAASTDNPWWREVLEYGSHAPHARYFDVDWHSRQPERANR